MELRLKRTNFNKHFTEGILYLPDGRTYATLEPPLCPSQQHPKGCIPGGEYGISLSRSKKFDKVLPILKDVPFFSGIRIHRGSKVQHTRGCILLKFKYQVDKLIDLLMIHKNEKNRIIITTNSFNSVNS